MPEKDPNASECVSTRSECQTRHHVLHVNLTSATALAYPELWADKSERLRKLSPYGSHPRWKVQSVIVKSGDDLRQDQLASQLISVINDIFKEAEVPLW